MSSHRRVEELKEFYSPTNSPPLIMVMGETGAGKSFFINKVAGSNVVDVGHDLRSCTEKPKPVELTVDGREFIILDTPGFNDTNRSDSEVLSEIAYSLAIQQSLGIELRGILFLHSITDARMRGSSMNQLKMLQALCGESNLENISLLTTKWPATITMSGTTDGNVVRENNLRREYWADMIEAGSSMKRFTGTTQSAQAIVRSMLLSGRGNVVLDFHQELIENPHRSLRSTAAGSTVIRTREEAQYEYERLVHVHNHNPQDLEMCERKERIELLKSGEYRLDERPADNIEELVRTAVKEELEKQGKKPTRVNIFSWIMSVVCVTGGMLFQAFGS